ncbi:hypothetical protein [Candidatus Stoquefichus sp. SB1]|jgi:predicted nucleic acid-binding protein|uniref:hypothetical protein n=1 Tax=Candidatus Stoquefichus sp. SB1 TaxID=1658109 RepID=UPI00067EABE1|nr:hypothetical protein [Candidatus Stoquefichus sp. SB1]
MEHVTEIDKKKYIDDSKEIVRTTIALENIVLTDHELTILTEEIMDTSLMMGGDYSTENIRNIAVQYVRSNFLPRFKAVHKE